MTTEAALDNSPRLLVIDDDNGITDLFTMMAAELKFKILCVHDFESITESFNTFSPEIIFLDLKLPGHDGIEVLHLLAELNCTAKIYIISGLDQGTLETAGALGKKSHLNIVGTLKKPFMIDDVERMLLEETDKVSNFTSDTLQELFGPGEFRMHYRPGLFLQANEQRSLASVELKAKWTGPNDVSQIPEWLIARKLETKDSTSTHSDLILQKALQCFAAVRQHTQCGLLYSPHDALFTESYFPSRIKELITKFDLNAADITLCINDSLLLEESIDLLDGITRLRINGVNISTSIANADTQKLDRLLHLPVNELRLRPELISAVSSSFDTEFDVSTLITACSKRGVRTRADGIRSESLLRFLVDCGCDIGQGDFLAKSLSMQEFEDYLQKLQVKEQELTSE